VSCDTHSYKLMRFVKRKRKLSFTSYHYSDVKVRRIHRGGIVPAPLWPVKAGRQEKSRCRSRQSGPPSLLNLFSC
jgi:hypothetical protein